MANDTILITPNTRVPLARVTRNPDDAFYHSGAGANRVLAVPSLGLVAVLRWVGPDRCNGFVDRLLNAVR